MPQCVDNGLKMFNIGDANSDEGIWVTGNCVNLKNFRNGTCFVTNAVHVNVASDAKFSECLKAGA
jgi:hypothetical protein